MSQIERVLRLVRIAQSALSEELARCRAGSATVGPLNQLMKIQETLSAIERIVQSGALPPSQDRMSGVGRMIVDSWPNDSELGKMILEAEHAYRAM